MIMIMMMMVVMPMMMMMIMTMMVIYAVDSQTGPGVTGALVELAEQFRV